MTQTVLIPTFVWPVCPTLQKSEPKPPANGKAGRQRALTPEQAAHIRMLRATGVDYTTLGTMFNVSRRTLAQAALRTGVYAA